MYWIVSFKITLSFPGRTEEIDESADSLVSLDVSVENAVTAVQAVAVVPLVGPTLSPGGA